MHALREALGFGTFRKVRQRVVKVFLQCSHTCSLVFLTSLLLLLLLLLLEAVFFFLNFRRQRRRPWVRRATSTRVACSMRGRSLKGTRRRESPSPYRLKLLVLGAANTLPVGPSLELTQVYVRDAARLRARAETLAFVKLASSRYYVVPLLMAHVPAPSIFQMPPKG